MTWMAFAVQAMPVNPLATVSLEVLGELWPALQTVLLMVDADELRFSISKICDHTIQAERPAMGSTGFVSLLTSFFRPFVVVRSS
jgi:hypothetical protein